MTSWAGPALSKIAEWAVSSVVTSLVNTAYSYFCDRMLPPDSEAELKRLSTALPKITAVMGIAEALKMKDLKTGLWVDQFRQAVEVSQVVLNELDYQNREEAGESAYSSKKRKRCIINDDTMKKLKDALTMMDRATAEIDHLLRLATVLGVHDCSESRQEASEVLRLENKVIGREVEKHKIFDWLKRPTDTRLSSFGIVGLGGIGKTTLAHFAYENMCGSNHFDKLIWVFVSPNFNVEDIMRKILSELDEINCFDKPLNVLQESLKEKIYAKKVFLILDDIWAEERRDWEQLIAPLRFVQQGSKILFTSRMKSVADSLASVISTEHESLSLQGLGEQEMQLLFNSYAFPGSNSDNDIELQAIGNHIVKKLRGSPLAAKSVGNVLNLDRNHQYWRRMLNQTLNL